MAPTGKKVVFSHLSKSFVYRPNDVAPHANNNKRRNDHIISLARRTVRTKKGRR